MRKILVVDDNPDNQDILIFRLRRMGNFELVAASNGKEALEVAARVRPDLILMDLRMPVMDGYEATLLLRQTEWGKNLPIIAVTAASNEEYREKALKVGCSDFIAKPIVDYSVIGRKIQEIFASRAA
ncbi:MAG TPA: response regulator [Candidatus Binatia bacterium]